MDDVGMMWEEGVEGWRDGKSKRVARGRNVRLVERTGVMGKEGRSAAHKRGVGIRKRHQKRKRSKAVPIAAAFPRVPEEGVRPADEQEVREVLGQVRERITQSDKVR